MHYAEVRPLDVLSERLMPKAIKVSSGVPSRKVHFQSSPGKNSGTDSNPYNLAERAFGNAFPGKPLKLSALHLALRPAVRCLPFRSRESDGLNSVGFVKLTLFPSNPLVTLINPVALSYNPVYFSHLEGYFSNDSSASGGR